MILDAFKVLYRGADHLKQNNLGSTLSWLIYIVETHMIIHLFW